MNDYALAERFGYTSDRIERHGDVPRVKKAIELRPAGAKLLRHCLFWSACFGAAWLRFFGSIVGVVSIGEHTLMEDAGHQNTARFLAIKYDMFTMLKTAQPWTNVIARSAQRRVFRQHSATNFDLADIADCLGLARSAKGVIAYAQQVSLSTARKAKYRHG